MHKILRRALLGDVKEQGFGFVDGLVDFGLFVVAEGRDVGAGLDEAAQQGRAFDGAGIVLDVIRGRHGIDHLAEVDDATDLVELVAAAQFFGHGAGVGRDAVVVAGDHRVVDLAVAFEVEVLGFDPCVDGREGISVEQDRPEGGTLGFDVVGERWLCHGEFSINKRL